MIQKLIRMVGVGLMLLTLLKTQALAASATDTIELKTVQVTAGLLKTHPLLSLIPWPDLQWLSFGFALGVSAFLGACLLWNASLLKTSVWVGHLTFVGLSVLSLTLGIFGERMRPVLGSLDQVFLVVVRFQFVLSSIMVYSLLNQTLARQFIGSLFSALIGGLVATSILQFFWPIDLFLLVNEALLIGACLYLCGKQYASASSKTLFFQLLIVLTMVFILLWLPELKRLSLEGYSLFAGLQVLMLIGLAGSIWSSLNEQITDHFGRMKREIYTAELRAAKQTQLVQLLQFERVSLERRLEDEARIRRQELTREAMKFKGLEEMSQDIAMGVAIYLQELNFACQSIMNECKSPKVRLQKIRSCADRSALLASKVEVVMSILQRNDAGQVGRLINGSDLLKECLRICHDKIVRSGVELEIESYERELWLEGRLSHFAQGFLGLLYNALEATEASDIRRITIRLRRIPRTEADQGRAWVELSVSNSGAGIPTAIKAKVFHSKNREGLGAHSLGLSMAFGIFERYGGSLSLDNEAVATTFVARIPLYQRDEDYGLRLAG